MIPIRLTIEGVYSYQNTPQTIEFGPLLDAGLFGIFGAVGSGKSSILEAISMALYGEIERLNKRDDRNYNMMNLKSDRLFIDFEFSNYTGQRFRFECEGRRNSKQYNEVNTYRRLASEWVDNEWRPLDHYDGEIVTGLSYENFKRTVIIPQGKFQDFLELTPGGRSQMLQDLFSLDKYDLAGATGRLISQNAEHIHRLEGRLTGYEEVTPELLKDSRDQLKQLNEQVENKSNDYDHLKKKAAEARELKKLYDQLTERQTTSRKLKENEPAIRSAERQLKKYQEARQDFSTRIYQVNDKRDSLSQLENSLDNLNKRKDKLSVVKIKISEKHELLRKAAEGHEIHREHAEEALIAGELKKANESLQHKEERIENGRKTVLELQNQIKEKENEVAKMEIKLGEARSGLQDRELLLELRTVFNRKDELTNQIQKSKERIEKMGGSLLEKKKQFFDRYDLNSYIGEESKVVSVLETRLADGAETIENHRKNWHQLKVQAEMASYVEQLTPGESCPLCGSTEHPAPAHFEATTHQIEQVKDLVTQLEAEQKMLLKAKLEWKSLINDEEQMDRSLHEEHEEIKVLQESLRKIEGLLSQHTTDYPDAGNVEKALESSAMVRESVKSTERNIKKVRQEMRKETGDLEKYREKIGQFRSECDQLKGKVSSLKSNLRKKVIDQLDQYTPEEWRARSEELIIKIQQEKEEFRTITEERDKILQEYIQLETSLKETKTYLDKERKQLQKAQGELDTILSVSGFESLDQVRDILKKELDVDQEQKEIRDHDRKVHVIEEGLKELKRQMGDREFDRESHENLIRECETAEKELLEQKEQRNYQVKKLDENKQRLEEKNKLVKDLSGLQEREGNLKVLEGLFRGKKFVDYVSTVYLREICDIANRRFRELTNNHFSLVLGEDNQFLVRDYLHDGQIRSVKTLSGGQTFQVSLCLALALAESLQNQSHSHQNFFFLDEGFGTLDGDALRLVMESLKSLRQEGRVVGVISHVESLQDEMDMYLHINNDAENGSRIEKSWEV